MRSRSGVFVVLSWLSVVSGILSYALAHSIPVGLDVAAILFSVIALIGLRREARKKRYVAWVGLCLGLSKLLIIFGMFLWIIIAFSLNPVAH
jgi:hypothetical protein